MSLKAVLDTVEGLPLHVRNLYAPAASDDESLTGKFILDVEGVEGFALENVGGLKNAFGKAKEELAAKTAALEGFKGLSASGVRNSLRELEKLRAIDPENEADKLAKAKIASAVERAEIHHAAEMKEVADEADRLWGALNTALVSHKVKDSILAAGGSPELLMPHVMARTKVDRQSLQVSVFREDGSTPLYRRAGNDVEPAGIDDVVAELRANPGFGRAFAADRSGSGAAGGAGKGTGAGASIPGNPFEKKSWNLTEQMRLTKADPARAAHLRSVAGV